MKMPANHPLFESHARSFATNRYVYPVLSRRAGGISIGVNLSVEQTCNFNCAYCQIHRGKPLRPEPIDLERLAIELDGMVASVVSGRIFEGSQFHNTPETLRRLNDIALSGDGEPTASPEFDQVVSVCADVRRRHHLDDLKIVLITNASLLHRPKVRAALKELDANGGEIWAKLDAGTEEYFRLVARTTIPWQRILDNLREAALERPIVIQSLWMRIRNEPPSQAELQAYCDRLREILASGGRIQLVQTHTIARQTVEDWVTALPNAELDAIATFVQEQTGLPVKTFYGRTS